MTKTPKNTVIPNFIDKTPSVSERAYDMFSKLLSDHRIVFVTDEITRDLANNVCA